jgi:hypothetical protein
MMYKPLNHNRLKEQNPNIADMFDNPVWFSYSMQVLNQWKAFWRSLGVYGMRPWKHECKLCGIPLLNAYPSENPTGCCTHCKQKYKAMREGRKILSIKERRRIYYLKRRAKNTKMGQSLSAKQP